MDLETINWHIERIQNIISNSDLHGYIYGKNKSIRNKANRQTEMALMDIKTHFRNYPEIDELLMSFNQNNIFGYEESLSFQYFEKDMIDFISYLKELKTKS